MSQIDDHPLRYRLVNELHARPFPVLCAPGTVVYLAIKQEKNAAGRERDADVAHLIGLLDLYGAPHPCPGATHYYGQIGENWLKWEQHTEFVSYTVICKGVSVHAYDPETFGVFPSQWLSQAPGQRLTSVLIQVVAQTNDGQINQALKDWFVPESTAVSCVLDNAAVIAGDFRIDAGGHLRFAVFSGKETGPRRLGRIVQRLCEIETYRAISMLGLACVQQISPRLEALDAALTDLVGDMPAERAEETLGALLDTSAELETISAQMAFRFGATGAYATLVNQRIEALREEPFMGRQSFAEFMARRYEPAMRTVKSAQDRFEMMCERSLRVASLLRTRVDVERSAQNQKLLESMDRRSDLQLRLQHTVEGLSVVAISYYSVSLVSYLLYPLTGALGLSKGDIMTFTTLPVVGIVWFVLRRVRLSANTRRDTLPPSDTRV